MTLAAIAYFAVSAGVSGFRGSGVIEAGVASYAALLLAAWLIRRPHLEPIKLPSPWWDLWFRMIVAASLTLAITTTAERLGPTFSGIIGTYPVVTTVVMTFTHHQFGREAAIAMLRGSVLSWTAFVSCFFVIGLTLNLHGLEASLALGALAALGTTIFVLWVDRVRSWPRIS